MLTVVDCNPTLCVVCDVLYVRHILRKAKVRPYIIALAHHQYI